MEAASSQHTCYYRNGYDISIPLWPRIVFHDLQSALPQDRRYFLTFKVQVLFLPVVCLLVSHVPTHEIQVHVEPRFFVHGWAVAIQQTGICVCVTRSPMGFCRIAVKVQLNDKGRQNVLVHKVMSTQQEYASASHNSAS